MSSGKKAWTPKPSSLSSPLPADGYDRSAGGSTNQSTLGAPTRPRWKCAAWMSARQKLDVAHLDANPTQPGRKDVFIQDANLIQMDGMQKSNQYLSGCFELALG
jgi:hypothetical protein